MRVATQQIAAPTATMFAVIASAVVALVPALIWHGPEMVQQSLDAYGWFALMGLMGYPMAFTFLNIAIKLIGASRSAPFSSVQPIFSFILGTLLLGEQPGILVAVGTPVIVAGLALVLTSRSQRNPGHGFTRYDLLGYFLATASSATFSGRDAIIRHVVSGIAPSLVTSAYALTMGSLMLLLLTLPNAIRSFRGVPALYIIMCILTGVTQGVAVIALFQALSRAPVTVVSPILATSSLFVLVIAHFTLSRLESVTIPLVVGTTLTVAGVAFVVLGASG